MSTYAFIYCRVSSEKQKREGHGLSSQEHNGKKYSEEQGYVFYEAYHDDMTGGLGDRPGINEMIADIQALLEKEPNAQVVVVIDDIKRWARDVSVHWSLKKTVQSFGGRLESPNYKFGDSPEDEFVENVFAAQAELERKQNRRQVIQKMKARMECGYWSFDEVPGYKYRKEAAHGKVLRRDDPKASVIQEALEGFSTGRFETHVDVQRFLESKSFSHRTQFKGVVHLAQVSRLISRAAFYAGFIEYPKWDISRKKGHHDALISIDTLQKIEEKLSQPLRRPFRNDLHEDFPLRGFLACAHCHKLMTSSWSTGRKKQYALYRCTKKGCQFQNKSVRKKDVEDRFESMLKAMTPKRGTIKLVEAVLQDLWGQRMEIENEQRKRQSDRMKQIDKEIDTLCERLGEIKSVTLIKKIESRVDQLEAQKKSLNVKKLDQHESEKMFGTALALACAFIRNPADLWHSDVFDDKRTVLNLAFTGILPYDKESGFGTVTFALPFELFRACEDEKSKMVEMPGIEPGSNVASRSQYDYVLFNSLLPLEEDEERGRGLTQNVRTPSRQSESNLASDAYPR